MTVFNLYAPEAFSPNSDRSYSFTFPAADDASVEVYEVITVDSVEYRWLVPVQEYTLLWGDQGRGTGIRNDGTVKFSRPHASGTTSISIERNTLIDQTLDMPVFRSFNARNIEYAFDKATLICQEIAQRKCNVVVSTYPITQEIVFTRYDDFKPNVINFAMTKLYTIMKEIDESGDDCHQNPEGT